MKRLLYAWLASICALPLFGEGKVQKHSWDADLFHRNLQVFSIQGEFLFWRVQEGGLDYGLAMTQPAWGPAECYAQGHFKNATFNGDPGIRLALRYFRAPHYWEFWTEYTRLTSSGSNSASKPSPDSDYLIGTWPQIFTNPMASAKSYIHMNYNVADLYITRVFFPNPHLRLRLIGGGIVAWINQFWKVQYADWASFETKITNRWSYTGGGLKIGTLFDWYWFTDIYMTGGALFGALLGSYHNSALQTTNFSPSSAYNPSLPIRNTHLSEVRPAFEGRFYLGPSYQKNLGCQRIEVFAGYELITWLNLHEIYRSTTGGPSDAKETRINSSMLALQGLTIRGVYDF